MGRAAGRARGRHLLRPRHDARAARARAGGCARARRARALGVALAYAWAAFPYTLYALNSNSNDTLVAARARLGARGAALAAAARRAGRAWARRRSSCRSRSRRCSRRRHRRRRRGRDARCSRLALAAVVVASSRPFIPDGGVREIYDRTLGYQVGRESPFSIWGQHGSLEPLWTALKVAAGRARAARGVRAAAQDAGAGGGARRRGAGGAAARRRPTGSISTSCGSRPFALVAFFVPYHERGRARTRERDGRDRADRARTPSRRPPDARVAREHRARRARPASASGRDHARGPPVVGRARERLARLRGPTPRRSSTARCRTATSSSSTRRSRRRCSLLPGLGGTDYDTYRHRLRRCSCSRSRVAVLLLVRAPRRARPAATSGWRWSPFALAPLPLGAHIRNHFDLVPVALTLAALVLLLRGPRRSPGWPCWARPRLSRATRWWSRRWRSRGSWLAGERRAALRGARRARGRGGRARRVAVALSPRARSTRCAGTPTGPCRSRASPAHGAARSPRARRRAVLIVESFRSDGVEHPAADAARGGLFAALRRGARARCWRVGAARNPGPRELVLASLAAAAAFAASARCSRRSTSSGRCRCWRSRSPGGRCAACRRPWPRPRAHVRGVPVPLLRPGRAASRCPLALVALPRRRC